MDEIRKINAKVARKQIGRIVGGTVSVILGGVLFGKFIYQKGVTATQKNIRDTFPEEYAAMTAKIAEAWENHN